MGGKPAISKCMLFDPLCSEERIRFLSDILKSGADVRLRVTGISMKPFLETGAVVTLRGVPVEQLRLGDLILCFHEANKMILHRLIGFTRKKERGMLRAMLITKGDALDAPDQPIDESKYMARVTRIGSEEGTSEKCRRMDNMTARASNYILALYHGLRSAVICRYMRFKKPHTAAPGDPLSVWFDRYLPSPFPLDHPSVLTWIRNQHLQGIIYRQVKECNTSPPALHSLENAYHAVLAANIRMLNAMEDLEAPLAAENISLMVFKGAALMENVYADPGMRPMEDIDILVRPDDRQEVEQVLGNLGYRRDENYPYMFSKNGICIDLHGHPVHADRLAGRKAILPMDINLVWTDSLPWRSGTDHIRRPCDADHLILMSHHMIKHSFSKWIWLHDAYMLLKGFGDADWREFARKTRQCRQEKPVAVMLYMTDKVFNVRAPERSPFADWVKQLSFLERAILNIKVRGADMFDLGNLLWVFCIRGHKQRLRFLGEAALPFSALHFRRLTQPSAGAGDDGDPYPSIHRLRRITQNLKILIKGLLARP